MNPEIVARRAAQFEILCTQVLELHNQGWRNAAEIAQKLSAKMGPVRKAVSFLIANGHIKCQRGLRSKLTKEEFAQVVEQVFLLNNRGVRNTCEIAKILKVKEYQVANARALLIATRRTKKFSGSAKSGFWRDLNHEKTQLVISMVKQRATLEQIGFALKTTREHVRQTINRITKCHGSHIFEAEVCFYGLAQVSEMVGVSRQVIRNLCQRGVVSCKRRSTACSSEYLFDRDSLEILRAHFAQRQNATCPVCKEKILPKPRNCFYSTCGSQSCKKRWRHQKRAELLGSKTTVSSLRLPWQKEVFLRLQNHIMPASEKWLLHSDAAVAAGIGPCQLWYLGKRGVITVAQDPVLRGRTGNPLKLYSASQMAIIKQVIEAFRHPGNGKV